MTMLNYQLRPATALRSTQMTNAKPTIGYSHDFVSMSIGSQRPLASSKERGTAALERADPLDRSICLALTECSRDNLTRMPAGDKIWGNETQREVTVVPLEAILEGAVGNAPSCLAFTTMTSPCDGTCITCGFHLLRRLSDMISADLM